MTTLSTSLYLAAERGGGGLTAGVKLVFTINDSIIALSGTWAKTLFRDLP